MIINYLLVAVRGNDIEMVAFNSLYWLPWVRAVLSSLVFMFSVLLFNSLCLNFLIHNS